MEKYFEQLVKIYNTIMIVSTKGEDTVIMGQCLTAMRDLLSQIQQDSVSVSAEADTVVE